MTMERINAATAAVTDPKTQRLFNRIGLLAEKVSRLRRALRCYKEVVSRQDQLLHPYWPVAAPTPDGYWRNRRVILAEWVSAPKLNDIGHDWI